MSTQRQHAGPLNITGEQVTLEEDATFTGPVTFNGPVDIKGEINVTGPLTFRGPVLIDKDAKIFVNGTLLTPKSED